MKTTSFLLTSSMVLAMAFTFSCTTEGSCDASQAGNVEHGTMTYDGQTYKTVRICSQTWMAENLNYAAESSRCYGDKPEHCEKYGRLYDHATAKTVCPSGWHLPSDSDWEELIAAVGSAAGEHLKDKWDWSLCDPEGMYYNWCRDTYGFSALPGGYFIYSRFTAMRDDGNWWSADISVGNDARYWNLRSNRGSLGSNSDISKTCLFSVRCLQN
jgi:uncharacterized protein (TIGR02145 family)